MTSRLHWAAARSMTHFAGFVKNLSPQAATKPVRIALLIAMALGAFKAGVHYEATAQTRLQGSTLALSTSSGNDFGLQIIVKAGSRDIDYRHPVTGDQYLFNHNEILDRLSYVEDDVLVASMKAAIESGDQPLVERTFAKVFAETGSWSGPSGPRVRVSPLIERELELDFEIHRDEIETSLHHTTREYFGLEAMLAETGAYKPLFEEPEPELASAGDEGELDEEFEYYDEQSIQKII